MLAFSLRRRSAPGSLNVRDDSASPNRQQQRPIPSMSSKKSLSSLFSLATKDSSPRYAKPTDEVGIVEKEQYPVYDAANPDHNPETNASIRLRSRRRSSSRGRSASGARTFLDSLASKMRAATEFFHKTSDSGPPNDGDSGPLPTPRRSVSPKKSVRFRSGTYSSEDTKSSPIDVPKKSAPTLPQLELPKVPFMNNFDPVEGDPIPTGRPPDTPVLKAKQGDSYFPGAIKPETFHGYQESMHSPLPLRTKLPPSTDPPIASPFDDSAAATKVHYQVRSPGMSGSTATADSDSSMRALKSSTENSNSTSETLYEERQDNKAKGKEILDLSEVPVTAGHEVKSNESQRAQSSADYRPPSAQVSFAVVHSQPSTARDEQGDSGAAFRQSVWTLASREPEKAAGDGYTSASDDGDVRYSRPISPQRSQRRQPTHEDIRRQFRSSRAQTPANSPEHSSSSAGSAVECEATFEHFEHVPKEPLAQAASATEEVTATDPPKPLPQTTPRTSTSEQEVIVPEHTVSPLNLKANVSSTSPSRIRRPFRFSNSTDKDAPASPIGNTSFSWHAKKADETPTPPATSQDQTPSPVSVPLPLSIPPKKWAYTMTKAPFRYANQYGWSPFDEDLFLDVFLSASHLHSLLLKEGGFYTFWKEAGLSMESAPTFDTEGLSQEQIGDLLQQTYRFRRVGGRGLNIVASDAMSHMFSPYMASNVNKYGPLATHHEDYSGEVSTLNFSTAKICSEAGPPCSEGSCNACMTRGSYDSSDGPSMSSSVSGYDSDVEATASDRENARLVGTLTPSRLPRPMTSDKTPTQTDYTKQPLRPLSQRAAKYYRGSETSNATVSTFGGMSEDEKFAAGII